MIIVFLNEEGDVIPTRPLGKIFIPLVTTCKKLPNCIDQSGQKQHPWECGKKKTPANPKEHKGASAFFHSTPR